MKQPSLPPLFDRLVATPRNELVEQELASGRQALGYTCSYVPEPLLAAAGLLPLRLRVADPAGTPLADTYLSSVLCPYVRSLLESALEGGQDQLAGWVFAASCDHLRRLYDNLRYLTKPGFVHILDVPHKTDEAALTFFTAELESLAERLAEHFGAVLTPAMLDRAIRQHNQHLELLRSIGELRKREFPPLSGRAFHCLLVASATSPKEQLRQPFTDLRAALRDSPGIRDYRARLLVVGSALDNPRYLQVIESQGGLVVGDRFCVGSLPGLEAIERDGSPLSALAAHYLRTTRCPRMMDDFETRFRDIVAAAVEYGADGIVLETMKFCDLWGVEAIPLAGALREAGWPVLRVEREYGQTGEGQLRTRVQAFIESMGQ